MAIMYEGEEVRPWEERGARRLDALPHRGPLVYRLGMFSLILGIVSFLGGVTGLPGLLCGIPAAIMAHHDVEMMLSGKMDRRGENKTRQGGDFALVGLILSLLGGVGWALFWLDTILPMPWGRA